MPEIIREARPDDAAQLIALVKRVAGEPESNLLIEDGEFNITVEKERQVLANFAAAPNSLFLVAEAGGAIVGMLACRGGRRKAVRHAVELSMSVDPAWRGQGIGSLLLTRAIQWARGTDMVKRIELAVFARNTRAIRLYKKFGFVVEGQRRMAVQRRGEYFDDLIMALLL